MVPIFAHWPCDYALISHITVFILLHSNYGSRSGYLSRNKKIEPKKHEVLRSFRRVMKLSETVSLINVFNRSVRKLIQSEMRIWKHFRNQDNNEFSMLHQFVLTAITIYNTNHLFRLFLFSDIRTILIKTLQKLLF